MLILNWFFILNGKMHGEILPFNNRFIYNGSNCFYLTSFSNESLLILIVAVVLLSGLSLLNHKTNYKRLAEIDYHPYYLCV